MTRTRIAEGLQLLVMTLANPGTFPDPPEGWEPHEWMYVKGLASSDILRLAQIVEDK